MKNYDFTHPVFKKHRRYIRLAREHMSISELQSDKISYKGLEPVTKLEIPTRYEITYYVKSMIGINEDQSPIYGEKHTIEIVFPPKFPLETFKAKATSPIWHPNIKWDGPTKGRICVNNKNFGRAYSMYLLVLRIGEIIQYKNYLAENIPPYPEDATVAKWVIDYAEPNKIVSRKDKIAIDDSNLREYTGKKTEKKKIILKNQKPQNKIRSIKRKNKGDNK